MQNPTNNSESRASKATATGKEEGTLLIKKLLKELTISEQAFVDGLIPDNMSLSQTVLKSLFETSLAPSIVSAQRDALRTAYQHLSEIQTMAQALQDAIQRHFGFHRFVMPSEASSVELECLMSDEIDPFDMHLPDGGLATVPDHLHEKLFGQGVVSHLHVTYPRSDKYGIPEVATHNGALSWLWNMGFHVSPDFKVSVQDSGCDGMPTAKIRLHMAADLLKELMQQDCRF